MNPVLAAVLCATFLCCYAISFALFLLWIDRLGGRPNK